MASNFLKYALYIVMLTTLVSSAHAEDEAVTLPKELQTDSVKSAMPSIMKAAEVAPPREVKTESLDSARDPFAPFIIEKRKAIEAAQTMDSVDNIKSPLTDRPLVNFKVIGTIVSPTDAVAVLRGRDRREYFATLNDRVGSEGGLVNLIDSEGMTVDIDGKLINMTVNNSIEINNEE